MSASDSYSRVAGLYDRIVGPLQAGVHRRAFEFIDPQPGWRVLDVGCGTGAALGMFRAAGCDIAGVDISPSMLERARTRLGDAVDLRLGDGDRLPFGEDAFDLVMTTMVLHEVDEASRPGFLGELVRVSSRHVLLVDFASAGWRGWRGPVLRLLIGTIERFAGHHRQYRSFRRGGCTRRVLEAADLAPTAEKIIAGGNIVLARVDVA